MPDVVFRSDEVKAVELAQSVAALVAPMIVRAISQERDRCANIALAIDSGRGNEKEIARAIRGADIKTGDSHG